jgi:hypothetical protein
MAEFMRRILKLFQDLDKEVTSIDDNLKKLLQIAKKISNIEETFSILAQTTSISGKLDKFCLLKAMIIDTFNKIEFNRIEKQPQEEIESSNSLQIPKNTRLLKKAKTGTILYLSGRIINKIKTLQQKRAIVT